MNNFNYEWLLFTVSVVKSYKLTRSKFILPIHIHICIHTDLYNTYSHLLTSNLPLYFIDGLLVDSLSKDRVLFTLICQVSRTEVQCLLSLWVKCNRVTLPPRIFTTVLQMVNPEMMTVSSPHTITTSTLMLQVLQTAMVKPNHKSTPWWNAASFASS